MCPDRGVQSGERSSGKRSSPTDLKRPPLTRGRRPQHDRHALPHTNAKRAQGVAATLPGKPHRGAADQPRTGHAQRMAQRNGAPVRVQNGRPRVDPQFAANGQRLRRERLVQLDEADVGDAEPKPVEQGPCRRYRADPHHSWRHPGAGGADIFRKRGQPM